ncbi:TetR/AcrR family transcriptional regulator [Salipiger pacificus]|uniref:TetR/AcrR family transcriptional regulator n=2 Tax=Salipiger mangrovisoli TaxID=2865933 RepID=A0ABR9XA45_9RHOB|nr:TetR/AcrR family transcriptional regulator [Salipiger mangrovisoli]
MFVLKSTHAYCEKTLRILMTKEPKDSANISPPRKSAGPKRTQAQRTEETTTALFEATMELMLSDGLSRLTTQAIAKKAGVSRGALTHHFQSREELIAEAIHHHLTALNEKLLAFAETMQRNETEVGAIADFLWKMMSGGVFYVTLEYLPEVRHNESLKARLVPVTKEFHNGLEAIWSHVAEKTSCDPKQASVILNMTMCLFRGMIAQTILRDDPDYYRDMLTQWKQILPVLLQREAGAPPSSSN